MSSLHSIIEHLRTHAHSEADKGKKFELLIKRFLETDAIYRERFSEVWMWMEWPYRGGRADQGVDLVAREAATGQYCAIQCKCYRADHRLSVTDVATFGACLPMTWQTDIGEVSFSTCMIVDTTDQWNDKLSKTIRSYSIPCTRLSLSELEQSTIDWEACARSGGSEMHSRPLHEARPHQREAIDKVIAHFAEHERGKLIMACGTGKTFTSLRLAEEYTGGSGTILFLVPSIALLAQSLREWLAQARHPLHAIAICSDAGASRMEEEGDLLRENLPLPACTDIAKVAEQYARLSQRAGLTVLFSTYQSLPVLIEAQAQGALPELSLVICDEAHRTTGVSLRQQDKNSYDESAFVRIHDGQAIRAARRLYMTATPRVYSESSRKKAQDADALLASMDDIACYGEEIHRLPFSRAVEEQLLTDYKVFVLCVDESYVKETFQRELQEAEGGIQLQLDDAVKLLGCYNGLRKKLIRILPHGSAIETSSDTLTEDPLPMRRAVAFCGRIKDSLAMRDQMRTIAREMQRKEEEPSQRIVCEIEHVDGKMDAVTRSQMLEWLKEDKGEKHCRILTNARCLSEGIDVPALDAVMFLSPRRSQVDIVQAVGRVMRRAEGKKYGYIILPIGIPEGVKPEDALDADANYDVVWGVLQALRAHDDRFNAEVNKIELNKGKSSIITFVDPTPKKDDRSGTQGEEGEEGEKTPTTDPDLEKQLLLNFPLEEWREAILARIVKKCGSRRYWESWAKDIAGIAERQIQHIDALLSVPENAPRFHKFLAGLRENINPKISEDEAIEMLAQQAITRPVFDALFEGYDFVKENPVSSTMNEMLAFIDEQVSSEDHAKLAVFYESVRKRAEGIDNAEGKQKIIVELYDKFFKNAFPRMADKLGIVYTPVEVVDFMIHSVHELLKSEFGHEKGLGSRSVRILDPFAGTGTFMVRLIQSRLMDKRTLAYKYNHELFASEIVLLAYYIACINIEEAFHGIMQADHYTPFEGICLTDTFLMGEKGDFLADLFSENAERVKRLCERDVRVIIANPPYSVGQSSANDNNQNESYEVLNSRIRDSYAQGAKATSVKSLYDSYIRAFRWASDRIGDHGIVAFVTNGSFLDNNAMSGFRQSLMKEFSSIYCFNLRGNQRTSGELSRREGGKIFGSGSRTPVTITLLVKKKEHEGDAIFHYHDIGDYLSQREKLDIIKDFGSINTIPWTHPQMDEHGDWLNHRSEGFSNFIPMGDKATKGKGTSKAIFTNFALGLTTNRDAWVYNFSKNQLIDQVQSSITYYNGKVDSLSQDPMQDLDQLIEYDSTKFAWTVAPKNDIVKLKKYHFYKASVVSSMYRPYCKNWAYFHTQLNHRVYQLPKFFPTSQHENLVITIPNAGGKKEFTPLISNVIPDLHVNGDSQCFPLYYYEEKEAYSNELDLDANAEDRYTRRDAITDWALEEFKQAYGDYKIQKEDIFYYVYGILHSPDYRTQYAHDLRKEMPRIPYVADFWGYSRAGRALAQLHLNYESLEPYPLTEQGDAAHYRVEKMRFPKKGVRSSIIYNKHLTLTGIPDEAYDYIVNGKSALEWLLDRYQVTTDKKTQITNDPNLWCAEQGEPRYIVDLIKRVTTLSLETMQIIRALPPLALLSAESGDAAAADAPSPSS